MRTNYDLIKDGDLLVSACYKSSGTPIQTYDNGFGNIYISRSNSCIYGIVRAQTWEDAYSICEDEFFPEADETIEEIVKEYGFKCEYRQVIKASVLTPESERHAQLGAYEKFVEASDYTDNGRLPDGMFIRWEIIETPDADAWPENESFQEGFGFRPNGANNRDTLKHGIYAKDFSGDSLDELTAEMLVDLGIELVIEKAPETEEGE